MVSFAFLAVMAFSAVPSPLYGLYRARDHFSVFMVTVVYAVYAVGVISALLLAGHLSDWYGRRRLLLPALGTAIASAIVFLTSKSLAGLLVGWLPQRGRDRDCRVDSDRISDGAPRRRPARPVLSLTRTVCSPATSPGRAQSAPSTT